MLEIPHTGAEVLYTEYIFIIHYSFIPVADFCHFLFTGIRVRSMSCMHLWNMLVHRVVDITL